MAEPPESLNIDDSYKTDEKSSPSPIPNRLTISLYLIALSESTLQASTSDSQHLECRQQIIPRHLVGPIISEPTLQDFTSDSQHLECSQQIIPRHPIGSDYESQPYKSDITPEPPGPLNIDDSSDNSFEFLYINKFKMPTVSEIMQSYTSEFRHLEFSQEDVVELDHERLSSKSDIMAELTEPLNIEDSSKSDEESSPSSKSGQLEFSQHTNDSASSSPAIMPSDDQAETYSRDSQSRQKKAFCKFTIECISFIIFFILSLILYPYLRLHIYQNDMRNITITFPTAAIEIEKGILGQDQIVQVLTEYLQRDTPLLKVVALIGDTSVEKSYTMDLIKKKFRRRSDNGFSSLDPNFVVLENLRAEHSADVINYVKTFQEAYGNRQISILAVFKVEQIDDSTMRNTDLNRIINTVKDTFIEANISIKIIPYEPLTENALEKHIINTAKDIRLTFSQDEIDIIKRGLTEDNTDSRKAYDL